jgi:hypothetical protein
MKGYLFLLHLVLFISYNEKAYCQEEFHGNRNGLSLLYLQGFNTKANAVGFSAYFKKGLIIGMGIENTQNTEIPSFNILYCPNWGIDSSHLKVGIGMSYGYLQNQHIIGFNTGLVGCFLTDSKFPFSINASISPQMILTKNQSSSPSSTTISEGYSINFGSVIGCGYTQAFFTKSNVYPFIGLSAAREFEHKINLFSAIMGINVKL